MLLEEQPNAAYTVFTCNLHPQLRALTHRDPRSPRWHHSPRALPRSSTTRRMHTNSKPCHNCRRRRLRCDRSWPSCHKCAVSGQECLGYGQLFVWTQAIDSSGNPKTASSSNRSAVTTNTKSRFLAVSEPALRPGTPLALGSGSRAGSEPSLLPRQGNHGDQQRPLELPGEPPRRNSLLDPNSASFSTSPVQNDSKQPPVPPAHAPPTPAAMAALTDPLFQDLDHNSRYYLAHCKPYLSHSTSIAFELAIMLM